jgi:uncharacterized membrane protein YfcA
MAEGFLGIPGVSEIIFAGCVLASAVTAWIGVVTGAAGGLILLGLLSLVFPPAILIPVHTLVQLGSGGSRVVLMWAYVLRGTLLPFTLGAIAGAVLGAQIFVSLPTAVLQLILALFMLIVTWMPHIGRTGGEGKRFAILGFAATFIGIFVSATGNLIAPFIAAASPDRRNHPATLAALMSIAHICKMAAFGFIGIAVGAYLPLVAAMIVSAFFGNWVGRATLDRMCERDFRLIFRIVMTLLALRLLWMAAGGLGWV